MESSRTRRDESNISISSVISTSCVMLENLQEFTPTLGECGYFTDYNPQSDDVMIHGSNAREPEQDGLVFESEATPFSHDMSLHPSGHASSERLHFEYSSPTLFPPLTTQSDCMSNINKTTYGIGAVDNTPAMSERNCSSSRHENSGISASGEACLYPNAIMRKDCVELQTDTAHSHSDVFSIVKYSEDGTPCTQWDVNDMSEGVDIPRNLRQEPHPADWPAERQTVSTFESNPARDGILEVNLCVSLGSVYDGVTDSERTDSMGAPFDGRHTSGRFHFTPTQESDKNNSQWLSANSLPQTQLGNPPTFLNVFTEMKSGYSYSSPETTAITHNSLQTVPSVASEVQADASLKLKHLAPHVNQNTSEQTPTKCVPERVDFFMGSAIGPQTILTNKAKGDIDSNSCLAHRDDRGYYRSVDQCHAQSAEGLSEKPSECPSYPMSIRSVDASESSASNNSISGFDSDDNCSENKQTSRISPVRQKYSNWTIDSIQQELEVLEECRKKRGGPTNSVQQRLENYKLQTMAKTKGSGLVDVDYMLCSGVTVAGFKPRAIIRKRSKVNIPSDIKDQGYWQKRRKNNDSARKSRELKKEKEKNFYRRALDLEYENVYLHECLSLAEAELAAVGRRITAPPMSSMGMY